MKSFPLLTALLLLAACGSHKSADRKEPQAATAVPSARNAEKTVACRGTYTGVFPAADAPGIAVTLTLGPDGRYTEIDRYCERPGRFTVDGTYTVDGTLLILRPDSHKEEVSYYRIGGNRLRRLDSNRQPITGPFADLYTLTKSDGSAAAECH